MELCGMECIDLSKNPEKILGIHFSYNRKIEMKRILLSLLKKLRMFLKLGD